MRHLFVINVNFMSYNNLTKSIQVQNQRIEADTLSYQQIMLC